MVSSFCFERRPHIVAEGETGIPAAVLTMGISSESGIDASGEPKKTVTATLDHCFRTKRRHALRAAMLMLSAALSVCRLNAAEVDSVKSVLVLLLGQSGLPAATYFVNGFRTALLSDTTLQIDVSAEHIVLSPFPTKEQDRNVVGYLGEKYRARRFDLIIAWGLDPLRFLAGNASTLWPATKIIACTMGSPDSVLLPLRDAACINVNFDFPGTVALIRRLHPETRHIALVGGHAPDDLQNLELARQACREGFPGAEIIDPQGETPREIMIGLARLPDKTVVILSSILADARGRAVIGGDWLPLGLRNSRGPMYTVLSHLVGKGVVGGSVTDLEKVGAEVGGHALRFLRGETSGGEHVRQLSIRAVAFDWRELKKWGINENNLPPGSEVRFRPPSFWDAYRLYILGTIGLLLILVLATTILAVERRNRKRAQNELEKRLTLESERLKLETLVSDLSLPLMKASAEQLPQLIAEGLRQMGEILGYDRGTYFEIPPHSDGMTVVSSAGKPGVPVHTAGEVFILPWTANRLRRGEPILLDSAGERLPADAKEEREFIGRTGLRSALLIPLEEASGLLGVLSFGAVRGKIDWSSELVKRLTIVGRVFSGLVADKRSDTQLQKALGEVTSLKQKLETENIYLREAAGVHALPEKITAKSEAMKSVLVAVDRVALTDATVLIMGETGTGKEVLASAIHRLSRRRDQPMIKLNCAALSPSLIEAELFGREKGAYTGALSRQAGRFELAHGSTIFLDEIGDLNPDLQVKLLRVLEDGELQRVGGTQTIRVDVRVIAATNRDLPAAVHGGVFREDLFYRLNVFPISVPPLRERKDDIPLLAWTFARELGQALGKPVERIPQDTIEGLQRYPWPGNVRELRNIIERALILGDSSTLRITLPHPAVMTKTADETIDQVEEKLILEALEKAQWRVRGAGGAAEILGLKPSTLEHRMKRHGLQRRH